DSVDRAGARRALRNGPRWHLREARRAGAHGGGGDGRGRRLGRRWGLRGLDLPAGERGGGLGILRIEIPDLLQRGLSGGGVARAHLDVGERAEHTAIGRRDAEGAL